MLACRNLEGLQLKPESPLRHKGTSDTSVHKQSLVQRIILPVKADKHRPTFFRLPLPAPTPDRANGMDHEPTLITRTFNCKFWTCCLKTMLCGQAQRNIVNLSKFFEIVSHKGTEEFTEEDTKSRAEGTVQGYQNRWRNPAAQPPHGFFALLKALRNSTISVFSRFLRRAAFTGAIFVAFVSWFATPENPKNVLSAPHCPLCRSDAVFNGSSLASAGRSGCIVVRKNFPV